MTGALSTSLSDSLTSSLIRNTVIIFNGDQINIIIFFVKLLYTLDLWRHSVEAAEDS